MTEFFDDDYDFDVEVKYLSKAAERRKSLLAIQEDLDELSDFYELPEGLVIPGVKL
ncbi:hypothetical protein ACIQHZ_31460 [Streptomyces halstedii]|uniref:hypothetical protein n=1 Tax=Streptomyces halstedii TaxID=1944 RepID=UPI0037F6300C